MRWPITELPLRSLLFVPGNSPRMIEKSWSTGADGIIFDLEDAVPNTAKDEARENVRSALEAAGEKCVLVFVRINSHSTAYWQADIKAIIGENLRGILLPKCQSTRELSSLEKVVRRQERARRLAIGATSLFLLIESAQGVLQAARLAGSNSRVAALVCGAEDFCSDMGIPRTPEGTELLWARSYLAICARAYGCLAIDCVYADFNDTGGLIRETELGKHLGFSGKLAIHPKQVETIHSVFAPSEQELSEAKKVLDAFAKAEAKGEGVVALDGKMIDKPVIERARRIMSLAKSGGRR